MRLDLIVLLSPESDDAFGVVKRVVLDQAQTFVTEFSAEGLDEPVSPGLSGWDDDPFCFTGLLGRTITDGF